MDEIEAEQTSTTPRDATPRELGVRVLCDASRGFVKGAVTWCHLRKPRKIVENVARSLENRVMSVRVFRLIQTFGIRHLKVGRF